MVVQGWCLVVDILVRRIERLVGVLGRAVSFLVLGMMTLIVIEMVSRGMFSVSLPWTHELSSWLLTTFIFLGGPYALLRGQFVRVDIVFTRLSRRGRFVVDLLFSTTLFVAFVGVLVWRGGDFFLSSFAMGERSATGVWGGPVWLVKLMIPLGASLLCVAWLAHMLRSWQAWRSAGSAGLGESGEPGAGTDVSDSEARHG